MSAVEIFFEEPKPIKLTPCKGVPVSLEIVNQTPIKLVGTVGVPGPFGVGILNVTATQSPDGTVTLYFLLTNGEVRTVSYAGGGEPIPVEKLLSGSAEAFASVTATLDTFALLSSTANASGNVTSLLELAYKLLGQASGYGNLQGALKADLSLASNANAAASIAAILAMTFELASSATARATASGFLSVGSNLNLSATAIARATANGSIFLDLKISGNSVGYATMSATMYAALDIASSATGVGNASGIIAAALSLMASSTGTGNMTGAVFAAAALIASPIGRAIATGTITAAAAGYDTDSQAAFNAMTVQPNDTRKGQIDTLIKGLKTDGVWTKLDWLCLIAAHDAQAGRLNLRNPAKALSAINSPAFTVDRGYKGDGVSAHLSFGEAYGISGSVYVINSAHLGVWINLQGTNTGEKTLIGSTQSTRSYIAPNTLGAGGTRMNDSTTMNLGSAETMVGSRIVTRTASNARAYYRDGSLSQSDTVASTVIATGPAFILRNGNTYCDDRTPGITVGSGLIASEVAALNSRMNTYFTAIGAM